MAFPSRSVACALGVLASAEASLAQPYYSLQGGSGEQFVIGDDLPVPIQAPTIGTPIGTGTMFPPLLIPRNANPAKALIKQTAGPDPKRMTLPPGVFLRKAPGPLKLGVANRNPTILQARTNLSFSAPAPALGSAVLKAGGRTGAAITTFAGPGGTKVRYFKTAAQFGGPAQTKVAAASPVRFWLRPPALKLPCKHPSFGGADAGCIAPLAPAFQGAFPAAGAKVGFATVTPGGPAAMSPGVVFLSVPNLSGLIAKSAQAAMTASVTNKATSAGFPWTTGKVRISAVGAKGTPEIFSITGMDSRVKGVGTISLVSGALSTRPITGPNANRAWMRLVVPEPAAALGAAAALATLAVCHGLARRRTK
jgi:hypothetical protein